MTGSFPALYRTLAVIALLIGAIASPASTPVLAQPLESDRERTEQLLRSALEKQLAALDVAAAGQSEREQLAAIANVRSDLSAYLHLAARAPQFHETAYRYVLSWKGAVFTRQRAIRAARSNPQFSQICDELQNVASRLAALSRSARFAPDPTVWQRQVAALSEKKEQLEKLLATKSSSYRGSGQPMSFDTLRASLPPGAALIDFIQLTTDAKPAIANRMPQVRAGDPFAASNVKPCLLAFLITSSGPLECIVLPDRMEVETRVDDWRSEESFSLQMTTGQMTPAAHAAMQWLRKEIWEPIEIHLPANTKTILISPDGPLARLAFAALPGKQPGTFLIEDWPIAIAPAPQALPAQLAPPANSSRARLLLMNPASRIGLPKLQFDKIDNPEFRAQDKAIRENFSRDYATVKDLYQKTFGSNGLTAMDGHLATEFAFRQHASTHRQLHITAHGAYAMRSLRPTADSVSANDRLSPEMESLAGNHPSLLTAMALARSTSTGSDPYNDGQVTAEEVQTLDLGASDLVFLISCEAGLGTDRVGDSMFGMQRAFHIAGARTVIAALWSVPVEPTNDLSARFYDNLWNKRMTKLDALREAQLWMARDRFSVPQSADPKSESVSPNRRLAPYFWAGFVLSGDCFGRAAVPVER